TTSRCFLGFWRLKPLHLETRRMAPFRRSIERLVVLGSGLAGLTAATWAESSFHLEPLVITGPRFGGALRTNSLINPWPDGNPSGYELLRRMRRRAEANNVRFMFDDVASIKTTSRPFTIRTRSGKTVIASSVIIAMGRGTAPPPFELEGEPLKRSAVMAGTIVRYCFLRNRNVAVVGGSHSAAIEALNASNFARTVTIVCPSGQLTCRPSLKQRIVRRPNIRIMLRTSFEAFVTNDERSNLRLCAIEMVGAYGAQSMKVDNLILAKTPKPCSELFENIKRSEAGYIFTKHCGAQTNIEGVFAAGSIVHNVAKTAISAAASGFSAAEAAGYFSNKSSNF
ncbi:MAG: NAD(P)/FAD-dependent oxidoreductase, partial [Candidatus Hodgkinia cicadicola]